MIHIESGFHWIKNEGLPEYDRDGDSSSSPCNDRKDLLRRKRSPEKKFHQPALIQGTTVTKCLIIK